MIAYRCLLTFDTFCGRVADLILCFVENVPGLQKLDSDSEPFGGFLSRLDSAGYSVDYRAVRLARYGIPQSRRRLVLVASRHGAVHLPDETNGPGTPNERYDYRSGLDFPSSADWRGRRSMERCRITVAANLSARNLERVKATPEGGGHCDWPDHLRLECHKDFSGYTDVYGRMSWDAPCVWADHPVHKLLERALWSS